VIEQQPPPGGARPPQLLPPGTTAHGDHPGARGCDMERRQRNRFKLAPASLSCPRTSCPPTGCPRPSLGNPSNGELSLVQTDDRTTRA
jgi:hypothetical protein